ncbi:PAS domain-containing protein [Rhodocista pekingensis]|uniref:PAS domain-containing protein n=1 Tax=Rhodocista pekingensis TaxID=201185 RepID=A0ABW2KZT3_9PROT
MDSLCERVALSFRCDRTTLFAGYYAGLLGRGRVPLRTELDLDRMRSILDSFVILEVEGPGMVRFRLAGTRERTRYGFEVTGLNYLDFVPEARRDDAFAAFDRMVRTPCGMYALIRSRTGYGRGTFNEALGFPFRSDRSGRLHLVFQSNDIDFDERRVLEADALALHYTVEGRRYIDIGFGLPSF